VIVIDASILVNVLGDDGSDGQRARQAVAGQDLAAPELIDVEVASVLRRHWLAETITARRFAAAVADLMDLPLERYPALPFTPRVYELRANLSAYDAVYVGLAEHLDCSLLTADRRLAAAPGPRCTFAVLA
jgi:predicted nucleic acid-binding protein